MKRTINNSVNVLHEKWRNSEAKKWLVRYYGAPDPLTGKQKRYGRSFRHKREADAFAAEKRAELNRGTPRDPINMTLGELVEEFRQARLVGLSYATRISYEHTTKELIGYFGRLKLIRDIQRRHAEAFIATRQRCDGRKGELSAWSKARYVINARALFGKAVSWGYIAENPFQASQGSASTLRQNARAKSTWHYLVASMFNTFIAVVPTARQRAMYWLMYGCGLRFGEAVNIRVGCVDLENKRVHIVNRTGTEDVPPFTIKAEHQSSSSKERSVPIPDAALPDIIEAMKGAFGSGGFLVLSKARYELVREHWRLCREGQPWGGHTWRPWQNRDMVSNALRNTKRYLCWANIELNGSFNLHTFRKSYAQNLANAGVPPRTLTQLLGHSTSKVTIEFYSQVTDSNQQAAAEVMNRLLTRRQPSIKKQKQGS